MTLIRISAADLTRLDHAADFVELLDSYARDPMGGGVGLSPFVRAELVGALLQRPSFSAWFAREAEQALGLITVFEGFSTFAARPLFNVHDLVVLPQARGRGVAAALLGQVEQAARARGCCKLTLEVLEGNRVAQAVYRRAGFAPYELDPSMGNAVFLEKKLD